MTGYYSLHTHSRYSARDALPTVEAMVDRAVELGQPALGLTDHGTIAGIHDLYRACKERGIKPFPGVEAYVSLMPNENRARTYHMGILAYNNAGWFNLIKLNNYAHTHFKYKPVLSVVALTEMSRNGDLEGLIALTGCHFGVTNTALRNGGFVAAKNVIHALQDLFNGDVYVELQHHNIVDEWHNELGIELGLAVMARELKAPTVITSDSHYLIPDDKRAHETLKRYSSWSDDPDAAIFPGDGYYMCSEEDMRERFLPDTFSNAITDMGVLLERNTIDIARLNKFTMLMPDLGLPTSSDEIIKKRTLEALLEKEVMRVEYIEQLRDELQLLSKLGFNDYLLLTAEVTDYMREEGILFNARGSASGSIVCWLLGITPLDPLKWGLRFDRFLSGERSKPPDIDLDVEHDRREEVISWLDDRYSTARIGTWRELKVNEEDKGSLRIKRDQYVRKIGLSPDVLSEEERRLMHELSAHKAYDGVGMHPAGVIVAPDSGTVDTVPMEWIASSKSMVTALDKYEVEASGFLKLDMLGSRTLTALKIAEQGGPHHEEIPLVDSAVMRRIRSGKTSGIFQLNGKSAQFGCRKLKPTKFKDLVAAMALFRPGVQSSGATDEYIRRRHGGEWRALDPMIESVLQDTYGMMLYQEQMMTLLREMGMNADDLNKALKAIKASNAATTAAAVAMDELTIKVNALTKTLDWDEASKTWLFEAMDGFVEYSFNKSHAVSYARIAFISAWYAVHKPSAFWTGVLTVAKADDVPELMAQAVEHGVVLLPPDVNTSEIRYTAAPELRAVRKGLLSIHGVGNKAAEELVDKAPFKSLDDLAARVNARAVTGTVKLRQGTQPATCGGVIAALDNEGALNLKFENKETK